MTSRDHMDIVKWRNFDSRVNVVTAMLAFNKDRVIDRFQFSIYKIYNEQRKQFAKKNCFLIVKIWSNYHWKRLLYLRHEIRGRCCERPVYASMEFPLLQLELNEWIRIEKIIRESRVVNGALDLNWISVGSDFNYDYYKVVTSCLPHLW